MKPAKYHPSCLAVDKKVESLLRVARAAKKAWNHKASMEDIDELHKALEEVKDIL